MYVALVILFVNFVPMRSSNPFKLTFSPVVRKFEVSLNLSLTEYLIKPCCISSVFVSLIWLVFPL